MRSFNFIVYQNCVNVHETLVATYFGCVATKLSKYVNARQIIFAK